LSALDVKVDSNLKFGLTVW